MTTPYQGICKPDSLVMTPTRELCIQIHEESMKFCHRTGYRCCVVYGGAPTRGQMEDLAKGCDLMVATPGRLNDFINRGIIEVKETYVLVLDEADRMLDMGFEKQMREIVVDHGMPAKEDCEPSAACGSARRSAFVPTAQGESFLHERESHEACRSYSKETALECGRLSG